MRIFRQQFAAILGLIAGAGMNRGTPGVHEHPAVRFVLEAHFDHVNIALQAEELACHSQRGAPLTRSSLSGQTFGSGNFVEVSLWNRGVDLVTSGGADPFVLVIDMSGSLQR